MLDLNFEDVKKVIPLEFEYPARTYTPVSDFSKDIFALEVILSTECNSLYCPEVSHNATFLPDFTLFSESLVPQEVGWMKGGHQGNTAVGLPRAPESRDRDLLLQQPLHGRFAEGHDDLGLDEFDLPMQPR